VGEDTAIRLTTLGAVNVTGLETAASARLMAQPKRMALLVFLAVRPPGEWVSRDRILAMFWPELPASRAQANLRTALHFLRRVLGPGTIASRGNAVGLSPKHVGCDSTILLEAPRTAAEALSLYRGEFLDAVHVTGAPDFERWVDRMRAALRARASEIAWNLSAAAESAGAWISAANHGRRATELAVDVEGATQRLIRLLDRAGDRGAALAEYERLERWLDGEFGIPPSPETTALITTIRGRESQPTVPAVASASGAERKLRTRSMAVLPFEDLSDGSGAYVANGIGEDLLTALSGVRGVRIVSRTSVRHFVERPPTSMREVHELLGVDFVLEGSVRLQGDRVRVTVQLIDAVRDDHLWAQTYDRTLTDVFEVQSDVALRIARALEAELSPREHRRLRRPTTTSLKAWQLYLKGREVWRNRNPADAARAADLFLRALDLDRDFAEAWVGLSDAQLVRAVTGVGLISEAGREARIAVDRALACDPDLGHAHATLGLILTFFDWNHEAAEREYRRAVELSPGYATGHQWYGNWLCAFGRTREGLAELAAAVDLDPLSPAVSESLGLGLYHAGRMEQAEDQFLQTLDLDPDFWRARLSLALCRACRNDLPAATAELIRVWEAGGYGATPDEAVVAANRLEEGTLPALEALLAGARSRIGRVGMSRIVEALLLMLLGRHEAAIEALHAAREDRSIGLAVMFAPVFDGLAGDLRFHTLMDESGLSLPRWRKPVAGGLAQSFTTTSVANSGNFQSG
jgi:TolB-like protein